MDREKKLLEIEDAELKQAEEVMKSKIHADIDRIAKKLNEETREKREIMSLEAKKKTEVRIALYISVLLCTQTYLYLYTCVVHL